MRTNANLHGIVEKLMLEFLDVENLLEEIIQLFLTHHLEKKVK
jgi:hypothetical protein